MVGARSEEERLGRISDGIDPGAVTTLLIGAMFMGALGRHLMPGRTGPMPAASIDAIVATLIAGLRPAVADGDAGR